MERDSRDDGLEERIRGESIRVNGKLLRSSLLHRQWTKIAIECYNRGCNCYKCTIVPPLDSLKKCPIKYYVMGYIQLGYYPQNKEEEQ